VASRSTAGQPAGHRWRRARPGLVPGDSEWRREPDALGSSQRPCGHDQLALRHYTGSASAYRITTPPAVRHGQRRRCVGRLHWWINTAYTDHQLSGRQESDVQGGLSTADDGTHPTGSDKNSPRRTSGLQRPFTVASGVSSAGGSLVAYKAEGPVTLSATDGTLSTSTPGGAGQPDHSNVAPVAGDDSVSRSWGSSLKIEKSTLLADDTDATTTF